MVLDLQLAESSLYRQTTALASGHECKVITGIDDHSRYCVIAAVVNRATGRAVRQAPPGRGAVRADLRRERHRPAADQAPLGHDRQDRAPAPDPVAGTAEHP